MDFYDLDLHDDVLDALDDMNFQECTPIQEHAIPPLLEGHDLIGVAQTGTGKTAAYLLPVLSLLRDGGYPEHAINCLIMAPTRELAQQIDQAMQGFAYYLDDISSVAVYGGNDGVRYEQEKRAMQRGANIIIATPGRLISHLSLGNVDLSKTSFFILDEADRMLDMGFSDDIMQIAGFLPKERQTIMFSATMQKEIQQLAATLLTNPVEVKLAVSKPAEGIHQSVVICHEAQKLGMLKHLFKDHKPQRVIIFAASKMKVKDLGIAIRREGYNAGTMHSDLSQAERDDIMFRFKSGQVDILVATDIVSRGIDIDDITMVVNYDVPGDAEDYVHRIGRTARAGASGHAITFVGGRDQQKWAAIEKFIGKEPERIAVPEELGEAPEFKPLHRSHSSHKRNDKRKKGRNKRNSSKKTSRNGTEQSKPQAEDNSKPNTPEPASDNTGNATKSETNNENTALKKKKTHRGGKKHKKKGKKEEQSIVTPAEND